MILTVFFLLVPVVSQDILGIFYSFDVDFYQSFDMKSCGKESPWHLVNYDAFGIENPNKQVHGIRALEATCASSFVFTLISGSSLNLLVYIKTVTESSGLAISVFNEDNTPLTISTYNKTNKGFVNGWSRIAIKINYDGIGYVNIKGKSRIDEFILIDSFEYIPNLKLPTKDQYTADDDEVIIVKPGSVIQSAEDYTRIEEYFIREGSGEGSGENSGEDEAPIVSETAFSRWVIAFIVVAVVTVVSLLSFGCYQLGKLRGRRFTVDIDDIEVEPERVLNIPRARPARSTNVRK